MRILHLVQKSQRRGAEVFASELSRSLRNLTHEVKTVYLYASAGPDRLPAVHGDLDLEFLESHPLEKWATFNPQLLQAVRHAIRSFRPDVVQVNGARTVKYGALAKASATKESWVLVYRNIGDPADWVKTPYHRLFYSFIVLPRVDGIVAVSEATMRRLDSFYSLQIPMVHIPRAVDIDTFVPNTSPAEVRAATRTPVDAPVVIFVGRLSREKCPERFLRVLHMVRSQVPAVHGWIVGDGDQRKTLDALANELGMLDCVHFTGTRSDVANYMQAADLLLLTSDTEGTPGVVLEAGALGLPVVATDVGGVSECVIDGVTGYVVAPNDEPQLASKVVALLQDGCQRSKLGEEARRFVRTHYRMESICERYLEFYRTLLRTQGLLRDSCMDGQA